MADVTLSWSDNSTSEDGFKIYKSTVSSPSFASDFTQIDSVGPDTTSYTLSADLSQVTEFAVTAYNSNGQSAPTKGARFWRGKPTADVKLGNLRNAKIPSATAPEISNSPTTPNLKIYRTTTANPTFPDDYTLLDTVAESVSNFTDEDSPYDTDVEYAFVPEAGGDTGRATFKDIYIPPKKAVRINPDIDNN